MDLLLAAGARHRLLEAVLLNRPDIARAHLERGEDANHGEWDYHGPLLMHAARLGYLDLVELLLAFGARVDATDDLGQTALVSAASARQFEVVELLLDRGADLDVEDGWDHTTLAYAALAGHRGLVDRLLARGARRGILDALALDEVSRFAELLEERLTDGPEVSLHRLSLNTDLGRGHQPIDDINVYPWRLARVAVARGNPEFVRIILDRGAAHRLEGEDHSLLAEAAIHGHGDVARLLIGRGADLHEVGLDGLTPLEWAVREGRHEVSHLLRRAGATH